jgi:UDP-2-acetamido-2,6-beta-L-arabino-hexul-4-ose reductase
MKKAVLVTGSRGFIGRNLVVHLRTSSTVEVSEVHRGTTPDELIQLVRDCDVVVHLAGVNRPIDVEDFQSENVEFTSHLIDTLTTFNPVPLIFASSTQAELDNPYGTSKLAAETLIRSYATMTGERVEVLRFNNVFGKWCRPNYNSVVATYVHNISRGLPLRVDDPDKVLDLVYVDDVVELLSRAIDGPLAGDVRPGCMYRASVGELAFLVEQMHIARTSNSVLEVGVGFPRALYATYISALEPSDFSYSLSPHTDQRGSFTEILRTPSSGQISFLTAVPGATRGSHYHHTKIEKFVVVSGEARFGFRCLLDDRRHEVFATSSEPSVVESIPGWVHDITNIGSSELVVLVWANEVFDPSKSDTYPQEV